MREEEIDSLSYPALQRRCKELGLPARGKASILRANLKQLLVEQQELDSPASSPKLAVGDVVPGNEAIRQSMSAAQSSHSVGDHTHATWSHTHQLSKLNEDQKPSAVDTATSAEKQPDVDQRKLVKSSALDAAKATPLPPQRPASTEQPFHPEDVDDASNKMSPTELFSESEPEYAQKQAKMLVVMAAYNMVCNSPLRHGHAVKCNSHVKHRMGKQEQPWTESKASRHWLHKQWPWLLCLILLSRLCWHVMQSKGQADVSLVGPRCNQQMHFGALEPLLAHSDARIHLAELWSGETADPQKAAGLGHFEDSGKQVPTYKALIIATVVMPTHSLQQGSEEDVGHAVKQHLVRSLVTHGASDAVTNQASALRRRFEHVALVK
ncbi:hypothetical protein WJX79_008531 [Trebouxia sp. C0005]